MTKTMIARRAFLGGVAALSAVAGFPSTRTLAGGADGELHELVRSLMMPGGPPSPHRLPLPIEVLIREGEIVVEFECLAPTRSRPLTDFPLLAAADEAGLRSYDITPAGIFWPGIRYFLSASALRGEGWDEMLFLRYGDMPRRRSLMHDGDETTVSEIYGSFTVRRGDDIMVRHAGSYPALAGMDRDQRNAYEITPRGLRFPGYAYGVVIPFPPAHANGFAWYGPMFRANRAA